MMLGLRTTLKEGTNVSAAEMVYGDTLQVPGDFFADHQLQTPGAIRQEVDQFIPCRPTYRDRKKRYVSDDLNECSHVFIMVDQ